MDRREFLNEAAALALIALHTRSLEAAHPPRRGGLQRSQPPPLLRLLLKTRAPLTELRRFYEEVIGLRAETGTAERLTIAAGATRITFTPDHGDGPAPFYHFAFNIPENKIENAWQWQKERTPLLRIPERLRDPRYPADVVNYSHWNAHSVFFLDPGGNVVEYIARHDLPNRSDGAFSAADILYASEIAFVVDDVLSVSEYLGSRTMFTRFRGAGDSNFTALGDDYGLLLVMKRGRILNFNPDSQEKAASVFATGVVLPGRPGTAKINGFPYEITFEGTSI